MIKLSMEYSKIGPLFIAPESVSNAQGELVIVLEILEEHHQ